MIIYRRFSKQWYWEANRKIGASDDITVVNHSTEEMVGCIWEFRIVEGTFKHNDKYIKIIMYDDCLDCLRSNAVIKALVSMKGCINLDEAEKMLQFAGIKGVIDKQK